MEATTLPALISLEDHIMLIDQCDEQIQFEYV